MIQQTMVSDMETAKKARELSEEASNIVEAYEAFEVNTIQDYEQAGTYLKDVKAKQKQIDEVRKSMTKPLDDAKKRIMDFFRNPNDILKKAEGLLKNKMLAYDKHQQEIAKKREAMLQKQFKDAEVKPVVQAPKVKIDGIKKMTIWKYRVDDINKVPREWLIIDEKKMNAFAKATKGSIPVEGITIYSEETIASSSR